MPDRADGDKEATGQDGASCVPGIPAVSDEGPGNRGGGEGDPDDHGCGPGALVEVVDDVAGEFLQGRAECDVAEEHSTPQPARRCRVCLDRIEAGGWMRDRVCVAFGAHSSLRVGAGLLLVPAHDELVRLACRVGEVPMVRGPSAAWCVSPGRGDTDEGK